MPTIVVTYHGHLLESLDLLLGHAVGEQRFICSVQGNEILKFIFFCIALVKLYLGFVVPNSSFPSK